MASEGLSEHLESALVAAAGGDALGWITENEPKPLRVTLFSGGNRNPGGVGWGVRFA